MSFFQNNFTPYSNVVVSISNNNPANVVTMGPHSYDDGLLVRLNVPKNCGMQQINGLQAEIAITAPDSFDFLVDASNFDLFAYTSADQEAQVIPVGEQADSLTQAEINAKNITPEYYP